MVERPTDLQINSDLDLFIDGSNDLALISGKRQLEQSVALDVMSETGRAIGGKMTGENIGTLENRIRQSLKEDEQVGNVKAVNIDRYDRRDNTIQVDVLMTENEDFTFEVFL